MPGFKEFEYQSETIDQLLKKVMKAKVDPDVIPVDDGKLNSFVNGLVNNNNACYMNVIFQTLARVPGIKDYFLLNDYQVHLEYYSSRLTGSLAERFGDFIKTYYAFNGKVMDAGELKSFISLRQRRFNLGSQEDAHEFLMYLVDVMGKELNR